MSRKRQRVTQHCLIDRQVMRQTVKQLGSLWVIQSLLNRLGITELIDRQCPVSNQADLSHGEVVAAMVANRLTVPRRLACSRTPKRGRCLTRMVDPGAADVRATLAS